MAEKKMPFGFEASYELYNARGERLRNVLLIENPGSGQTLQFDIVNVLVGETITLKKVEQVSKTKFHFKLHFAAGALADRKAGVAGEDWAILQDGTDLYLAWRSPSVTLAPKDRLVMQLHGVSAGPEAGTEVTMKLSWPTPNTDPLSTDAALIITPQAPGEGDYELEYNLLLATRDRRGRPDIPLRAVFVGPNQVLNVDNEETTLTLRLFNSAPSRSQETLRFRFDANQAALSSRLTVALPVGTAAAQPWALGTKDQLNGVVLELGGTWRVSGPTLNADSDRLEWELTPTADVTLAPQASLDISLSKLKTGHPSGTANLELRHSAVPGYWDGEIVCPIEKAPLVFGRDANKDKVGIGESLPHARLTVQTASGQHGFIHKSDAATGAVEVGTYVKDTDNDSGKVGGYVGTRSKHPLHFFTNNSSPRLTLTTDGHLHVPGPLVFRVHANSTGEGGAVRFFKNSETTPIVEIDSTGNLQLGGSINLREYETRDLAYIQAYDGVANNDIGLQLRTQKNGARVDAMQVTPEGRVKDKTGFLVPVGTIVAYGGSTAPAGWLLCRGQAVSRADYADLFDAIGVTYGSTTSSDFKVPSLAARVPIGAHGSYTLGQSGGEFEHRLTTGEMPAHKHDVTDPGHVHTLNSWNRGSIDVHRIATYYGHNTDYKETELAYTGILIKHTGSGQAHNNMQPYLVVNYIIKH